MMSAVCELIFDPLFVISLVMVSHFFIMIIKCMLIFLPDMYSALEDMKMKKIW